MKLFILSDFLPNDKLSLSTEFEEMLFQADAILFNLEGSPQLPSTSENAPNQIMPFQVNLLIDFLKKYNEKKFYLALANNHILDNGLAAFDYMLQQFKENGINYFGTKDIPYAQIEDVAILNIVTAETVAKEKISRQRLNYLFYDTTLINQQIQEIENTTRKCIFYPHWGRDMDISIFNTYHNIRKNKEWLTFGHHPHVISGVKPNEIYSMGNNYIPHPYYFASYPATHFGLAISLNTESMQYDLYLSSLKKTDATYSLHIEPYDKIPEVVLAHGKDFGPLKKIFLNTLAFRGNKTDLIRLRFLQYLTTIFSLKYKLTNK